MKKILLRFLASAMVLAMTFNLFLGSALPVQADTIPEIGSSVPVVNGDFENLTGGWALPWSTRFKDSTSNVRTSIDSTTSYSGSHSLKFESLGVGDEGSGLARRMEVQNLDADLFSPYVTYEISARVKTDWTKGAGKAWFLIEYYYPNGSWHSTMDNSANGIAYDTQGQWVELKTEFRVPIDAGSQVIIAPRFSTDSLGTVWFDDVQIKVSRGPEPYRFDTDKVFPYPDEDGVDANVYLEPYYTSKPEANAKVDFVLYDSETETIVASQLNTSFIDLAAHYFIPIANLSQMKHKYTLVATVKDGDGHQLDEFRQNLYKYPRPKIMDSDGDINFGSFPGEKDEKFNINIFYGVDSPTRFQMAKEAGASVVFSYFYMENLMDTWTKLDDTGLKIMYNLRVPPRSAGHPDQIDATKATVAAHKDDPRVFAWMVDDEPLGAISPIDRAAMEQKKQELEAAYVAIRNIDDNHPVYLVDFGANQYETRKYSDVFSFDAYVTGSDTTWIESTIALNLAKSDSRPVYNLVQTYFWEFLGGEYPTVESIRNSVYRTFEAGGRGVGYFQIDRSFLANDYSVIANLYDTYLWRPFSVINRVEVPLLFDLYVSGKAQILGEYRAIPAGEQGQTNELMWKNWVAADGELYVLAYNKGRNTHSVTIPLKDSDGNAIGDYMAVPVGVTEGGIKEGSGSLTLSLEREGIALYKITGWKTGMKLDTNDTDAAVTVSPVLNNARQGEEATAPIIKPGVQSGTDFPGLYFIWDDQASGGYLKVDGNVFNKNESFTITTRSAGWNAPSAYLDSGAVSFVASGDTARGKVLKLEAANSGEAFISTVIPVDAGGAYDITGWLKSNITPGSDTGPNIECIVYDHAGNVLGNAHSNYLASTDDEWKTFSAEIEIPSAYHEAATAEFRVKLAGNGTVYFDDIQCFKQN